MIYNFSVSPSIMPSSLSGWHLLNTFMQKSLDLPIHFEMYPSFESQREAILSDNIDIIYANPFDASLLAREKGFLPVARPFQQHDEAIIAVSNDSGIHQIEDLQPGCKISSTNAPHVKMIGMIMLEPANLSLENIKYSNENTYVVVAKKLLRKETDAGIFLAESFDKFSRFISQQLTSLVRSDIQLVRHGLMISPKLIEYKKPLTDILLNINQYPLGASILENLEIESWENFSDEDVEFMIDLISTLTD